mgnify:CR=1 FL=1
MNVLIIGGGFAGVKLARNLANDARFSVTLMSDRDHFEYHAALYRSATGRSHLEVAVPLAEVFANSRVTVVQDTAVALDNDGKTVMGSSGRAYPYDQLVLAMGVVTGFFNIPGLAEHALGFKSIAEADHLKEHLHAELGRGHVPETHYAIVGAGPSGVELAGELVLYLKQLRRAHGVTGRRFTVHLIEAAPRVLPTLPPDVSARVARRLARLGVEVHTNLAVKGETANHLRLPDGRDIKTHLVIWTAGVTGHPVFKANAGFTIERGRAVKVGPDLAAAEDIYGRGDAAATRRAGWAQTALYDADYLAASLKARLDGRQPKAYRPHQPIAAVPVGAHWCAVVRGSARVYGRPGWAIRRLLDRRLFYRLLPAKLARRSWLSGTQREESCPECAQAYGIKPTLAN